MPDRAVAVDCTSVPPDDLPLFLAELHRSLDVGSRIVGTFGGDIPDGPVVLDVLTGGGFTDIEVSGTGPPVVHAVRARTLPDTVGPGMRVLMCGLNPSVRSADAGTGFFTPGNRFWPAVLAAGLASRDRDPWHAVRHHGMGMTDLVKRATPRADVLTAEEYRAGWARVDRLCARFQPEAVCMVGLTGWRVAVDRKAVARWQDRMLGGRPVYVMPSTSGLNAHARPADILAHLRAVLAGP